MTDVKKVTKKKATKHIALKKLFTQADGLVKVGCECTCTEKEAKKFKEVKAI
jgi:hypothetical protein